GPQEKRSIQPYLRAPDVAIGHSLLRNWRRVCAFRLPLLYSLPSQEGRELSRGHPAPTIHCYGQHYGRIWPLGPLLSSEEPLTEAAVGIAGRSLSSRQRRRSSFFFRALHPCAAESRRIRNPSSGESEGCGWDQPATSQSVAIRCIRPLPWSL